MCCRPRSRDRFSLWRPAILASHACLVRLVPPSWIYVPPRSAALVSASLVFAALASPLPADVVTLKNGGEVRGEIVGRSSLREDDLPERIKIRTLTGGLVEIDRDDVRSVKKRRLRIEEYETRAQSTPDEVEAQWEMAEWCRNNYLARQRERHLKRVVELDPHHERAHRALGHVKRDGEWVSRDLAMKDEGYIAHKGRYITQQELELLESAETDRQQELDWFKKVRLWKAWLAGRDQRRSRAGLEALKKIDDPYAVAALTNFFQGEEVKQHRELYVQILAGIPGEAAVRQLVEQSLIDSESRIRSAALDAIGDDQFPMARPYYVRALQNSQNDVVRRAARGLAKVGDQGVVPHLIEALVTTHRYRVRVPNSSPTYSFSTDGTIGAGGLQLPPDVAAGIYTGQYNGAIVLPPDRPKLTKIVYVDKQHNNVEVLSALKSLTGQSFGYNQSAWRLWWESEKVNAVPAASASS